MLKNMRVFIAYCMFFNPDREMATGFTNITGITSRTSKLINHHGFRASGVQSLKLNIFLILKEVKTNLTLRSVSQKRLSN